MYEWQWKWKNLLAEGRAEEGERVQYLETTMVSNGEYSREVKNRIQVGWSSWRRVSAVICDRRVPAKVKGKVYKTVVRPSMLYCKDMPYKSHYSICKQRLAFRHI